MRAFLSEGMRTETALQRRHEFIFTTRILIGLSCILLNLQIKLSEYLSNERRSNCERFRPKLPVENIKYFMPLTCHPTQIQQPLNH